MSRQAKNYTRGKKSTGKGKTNNYKSKSKGRTSKSDLSDDFGSQRYDTHNDVSWYTPDQQILRDVARLPYSIPTGMPFPRPYAGQGATGYDVAMPGVLVQYIVPTLGYAAAPSDPVNVAAEAMYSFLRHLNSGGRNYDPVDIMLYMGAMDSIYSCLAWCTRIYATLRTYSQGNRYLPKLLLEAQHLDYNDFANNLTYFRGQLNLRISKASQLMVPKIMPLFERHRWLFTNYYIEGDSMKDQIYLYAPRAFYKFDFDSDSAGMLKAIVLPNSNMNVASLLALLDLMLDAVISDFDFNLMSGDIYRAYGGNVVTLQSVPDDVIMDFTYDEKVLLQFKNSKSKEVDIVSDAYSPFTLKFHNDFFDITQDSTKKYLVVNNNVAAITGYTTTLGFTRATASSSSDVKFKANLMALNWSRDTLLTSPRSDVSEEENMVMTRGTMAAEITLNSADRHSLKMFYGSEWYLDYSVYTLARNRSTGAVTVVNNYTWEYSNLLDVDLTGTPLSVFGSITTTTAILMGLSKFKYHPEFILTVYQKDSNGSNNNIIDPTSLFEVDNYTVLSYNVIKAMHDAALLGEFNIPRVALLPS